MTNLNFTELKIKNNSKNYLFGLSLTLFILSCFIFFIINFFSLSNKTKAAKITKNQFKLYTTNYSSIEEINYIPKKINNYEINSSLLKHQAKEKYQIKDETMLVKLVNERLFSYLALNNFFNLKSQDKLEDLNLIETELKNLTEQYNQNLIKISGFYLKTRFKGIFDENLEKLSIDDKNNLKDKAKKKLIEFIEKAKQYSNPELILETFNNDPFISLINNNEQSIHFENIDPPLFDDPNFYQMIEKTSLNEFSDIFTLKTKNPLQNDLEEYAYVVFYLKEKSGKNLPLTKLINQYIQESHIF